MTPRGQDGTGDAGGATTKVVAVSGQADGDQQPVDALVSLPDPLIQILCSSPLLPFSDEQGDHDPMLPLLAEIVPKSSREAENKTKRTGGEEPVLGEDKVASAAELGQEKMGHLVPDA